MPDLESKSAEQFKVGDIVEMKHGGPLMTVTGVHLSIRAAVACAWFDANGHLQRAVFEPETIGIV